MSFLELSLYSALSYLLGRKKKQVGLELSIWQNKQMSKLGINV